MTQMNRKPTILFPKREVQTAERYYIIMCYNNATDFIRKALLNNREKISSFLIFIFSLGFKNSRISVLFRKSRMSGFAFGRRGKKSLCGICRSSYARNFVMSIFVEQSVALFSCTNFNWKCEA